MLKRYVLFLLSAESDDISPFVLYHLKALHALSDGICVIARHLSSFSSPYVTHFFHVGACGDDADTYRLGILMLNNTNAKYDELIITDDSCYGPIYPYANMLSQMSSSDCHIWGILPGRKLFEPGQISFWVIHNRLLFSSLWNSFLQGDSALVQNTFEHNGICCKSYCGHAEEYENITIEGVDDLVITQSCPLLPRCCFYVDYSNLIANRRGDAVRKAFDHISTHTSYPINLIWKDLLSTQNYYHIKNNLQMNYILPSDVLLHNESSTSRVALCFHVYYESLVEESMRYMLSMPHNADIYLTTSNEALYPLLEQQCAEAGLGNIASIRLVDAKGRSESALLIVFKEILYQYDYVCFAHDKLTSRIKPAIIGKEFGQQNLDGILKSIQYVQNIISRFDSEPQLGILEPFNTTHSARYREITYGNEWGIDNINYEGTVNLLRSLGICAPIQPDCPPISPMGTCFWFRPEALKKLFDFPWTYDDFPPEPLNPDGELNHFIERCFPFVAQDAGYYTAWVSDVFDARVSLTNMSYLYREQNLLLKQQAVQLASSQQAINEIALIKSSFSWRAVLILQKFRKYLKRR